MRSVSSTLLAICVLCLSLATTAFAQDYDRPGFYAGIGVIGGSYTEVDDELERLLQSLGYSFNASTDTSVGFELHAGYRLMSFLALEGEFELLPEVDIQIAGIDFAKLETWSFTANAKAYPLAPLPTSIFDPFVLAGIGVMGAEITSSFVPGLRDDETDFAARFGGGLDVYVTEHIAITAGVDYVLPTGDVKDLDYLSFGGGLMYRF